MVRLYNNKTKIASAVTLAVIAPVAILASQSSNVSAEDVTFNVDIPEVITMSIAEPETWASGNINTLLKNKVTVSARTNNSVGVTVSMYATNTNLVNQANSSYTIPTLTGSYSTSNFPANYWGYSVNSAQSSDDSGTYSPLSSSAIGVFSSTTGTEASRDVYFGAKADSTKPSGTYAQTVYFTAVTGTVNTETPVIPTPPTPATPDPTSDEATYDSTVGATNSSNTVIGSTTYTTRSVPSSTSSSNETRTTTTHVSAGNTTASYANAQGVTTTSSSSDSGASVATALGVAAAVAAASGTAFFILAKRKKDDDEEE